MRPGAAGATAGCYACPVYATAARFRQEVATLHLRVRGSPDAWTLAGTAALCEAGPGSG